MSNYKFSQINDYITIENFTHPLLEYKVRLNITDKEFLALLKNTETLTLDCDKSRDWSIELINCIGAYISQYLSSWHKLILHMPYLKYSRQERKTYDDCDQLTAYLDSILHFNTIETIYLHNDKYKHKTKKINYFNERNKAFDYSYYNIILADGGLLSRATVVQNLLNIHIVQYPVYFKKVRKGDSVITTLPENFELYTNEYPYMIIDDIIDSGKSMVNAINLLKEYVPLERIKIGAVYIMSDYSIEQLVNAGIKKENIQYVYKVI